MLALPLLVEAENPALGSSPVPAASPKAADVIFVHGARQMATAFSDLHDPSRAKLERFIQTIFKRAYGAEIKHFMPRLMSLTDQENSLLAVCGLRQANQGSLFLEHYMDKPVESMLADRIGTSIQREEIVEVGNLAVAEPGLARQLLAGVINHLHGTPAQWAVFTAIPSLRNSLAKLNVQLEVLCEARLDRLPEHERAGWGSYYDQNPQVMAVRRMPQFSH